MKILIVDDDDVSRQALQNILISQEYKVVSVKDGLQAWEAYQKDYYPVIILDWLMPNLSGLDLCHRIRNSNSKNYSYIILTTCLSGKTNFLEAMKAEVDDFMTKPVDKDQILCRIHVAKRILGLRQYVNELRGLLPICAHCKDIRDGVGKWRKLEDYIRDHSEATFSHGLCPSCVSKLGFRK